MKLLGTAADEDHEQGDAGGGKQQDKAGAPLVREDDDQEQKRQDSSQTQLGKKAGKIMFKLVNTSGDGLNQRSGFIAHQTGRSQGLDFTVEPAADGFFDPGSGCCRGMFQEV